jgi:hypothetical protein
MKLQHAAFFPSSACPFGKFTAFYERLFFSQVRHLIFYPRLEWQYSDRFAPSAMEKRDIVQYYADLAGGKGPWIFIGAPEAFFRFGKDPSIFRQLETVQYGDNISLDRFGRDWLCAIVPKVVGLGVKTFGITATMPWLQNGLSSARYIVQWPVDFDHVSTSVMAHFGLSEDDCLHSAFPGFRATLRHCAQSQKELWDRGAMPVRDTRVFMHSAFDMDLIE